MFAALVDAGVKNRVVLDAYLEPVDSSMVLVFKAFDFCKSFYKVSRYCDHQKSLRISLCRKWMSISTYTPQLIGVSFVVTGGKVELYSAIPTPPQSFQLFSTQQVSIFQIFLLGTIKCCTVSASTSICLDLICRLEAVCLFYHSLSGYSVDHKEPLTRTFQSLTNLANLCHPDRANIKLLPSLRFEISSCFNTRCGQLERTRPETNRSLLTSSF